MRINNPTIKSSKSLSEEEIEKIQPTTNKTKEELEQINKEIEEELNSYLEEKKKQDEVSNPSSKKGENIKFYGIVIMIAFFMIMYKLAPIFVELWKDLK